MNIKDEYEMTIFKYKAELGSQFPEYKRHILHPWWREHFKRLRQLELLYEQI